MHELSVILIIWGMCCVELCYGKPINRFWFRLLSDTDPLCWLSSVLRPPPHWLLHHEKTWIHYRSSSEFGHPSFPSQPLPPAPFPSQSYYRPDHTAEIPPQPSVQTRTCQRGNGTSNRISKTLALFSGMPHNFTISLFVWQSVQIKHPFFPSLLFSLLPSLLSPLCIVVLSKKFAQTYDPVALPFPFSMWAHIHFLSSGYSGKHFTASACLLLEAQAKREDVSRETS